MEPALIVLLYYCRVFTLQVKWTERMWEDPAVKATMYSTDTYKAFYKTYVDGKPDYDYGLQKISSETTEQNSQPSFYMSDESGLYQNTDVARVKGNI